MSGVSLLVEPPRRAGLPWAGPGRYVPRRGRVRVSRWALLGVLLALVLATGGTAATLAAAPPEPEGPTMACAPGGAAGRLTAEQRGNATKIIAVGRAMDMPERAQVVAVATAMQESSLINLDGGDRDSAGLFQQRPSQGWGTYREVTDPTYSSRTFYDRLNRLPAWERMPVTVAAQTVQRSAFPSAYAKWQGPAAALVSGTTCEKR